MSSELVLLDVTDTTRRRWQHGLVVAGVGVLLFAKAAADRGLPMLVLLMLAGFALFGIAATIKQRWSVSYKGHDVRYENNPLSGERLFIDTQPTAKGKLGYRSEMRSVIANGDGAGDTIVVHTEAGLFAFRCRITARPAASGGVPASVSDDQLLAELRRRGLGQP